MLKDWVGLRKPLLSIYLDFFRALEACITILSVKGLMHFVINDQRVFKSDRGACDW